MRFSDPQKFTILSAAIIISVTIATGYAASIFYRQEMIARELDSMHELVSAVTREEEADEHLFLENLKDYADGAAQENLKHSFRALTRLSGLFQIKVFNADKIIAWSTVNEFIGTRQTQHMAAVTRALSDGLPTVFNPALTLANNGNVMELYVPFRLGPKDGPVAGVVSVYRSSGFIDSAIRRGTYLLWLATGLGGIIDRKSVV